MPHAEQAKAQGQSLVHCKSRAQRLASGLHFIPQKLPILEACIRLALHQAPPQPSASPPNINRAHCAQVFHLPSAVAADRLLVGHFRLKRQLHKLGIKRWPARRLNSLDTLIASVTADANMAVKAKEVSVGAVSGVWGLGGPPCFRTMGRSAQPGVASVSAASEHALTAHNQQRRRALPAECSTL
ncbi:MAG: hypothetical protein WDW38_000326 [Sanguina aurantia]